MTDHTGPGGHRLALWRDLQAGGALRCPACRGTLNVGTTRFDCASCLAFYPVEGSVPLLMRPGEIVSISDQVMGVFNIPTPLRDQVEGAMATMMKYRSVSHPEFANFFARFDGSDAQALVSSSPTGNMGAVLQQVTCLTHSFPDTLRSDEAEFRSLRLRNDSCNALLTDAHNPLYITYRIFSADGVLVPFDGSRSPLPCPIRPGAELTVPVRVELPKGLGGRFSIRFYFVLIHPAAAAPAPAPAGRPKGWLTSLLGRTDEPPVNPPHRPETTEWFYRSPLAEMTVSAITEKADFPATLRGDLATFDLAEDVSRAESFVAEVIADLRSKGVARPRILELGCGVYPLSLRICDQDMTVIVSDISLVMQTLAAIMHAGNPAVLDGRAGFASFDMMYPPFAAGSFDVICICAAMHHIASPVGFLERLAPLLSEHGRFVAVREPCLVSPVEPTYITELANGFNEQMFELPEWQQIIASGGLQIDRAVIDFDCSLKFSARVVTPG